MVIVTSFMGKLKVRIRQFYVKENGEMKPGKSGIVLEIEEFYKLVELIPQIKKSIERYELKDTVIPSSPFQLDPPVLDLDTVFLPSPPIQDPISILSRLFDSETKFPSLPLIKPSLENVDDNSPKKRKEKGKRSKEITASAKKKLKTENKRSSGIFVGYAKIPCEVKETTNKKSKVVKQECIDKVASVESIKEVERKLWLTHYDMLSEKLMEVIREKFTGCQTDEPNQLVHD